jgi:hypothetical protein
MPKVTILRGIGRDMRTKLELADDVRWNEGDVIDVTDKQMATLLRGISDDGKNPLCEKYVVPKEPHAPTPTKP